MAGAQLLQDPLEPLPLVAVGDLARDADVVEPRHEDEVAARQAEPPGDLRSLGADRLLDHLHENLLALLQVVVDAVLFARTVARLRDIIDVEHLEVEHRLQHVGAVQKGGLGQADLEKGGLDARAGPR